ncbi:SWIM zinc finger family protein [Halorussus caseinilyticus]|uniref:SWIM zinc finger family protein n=1 Tax=Halorussus caseinilyticus TaxID=3034025 RepID=A0ABD5WG70_9EURY
MTTPLARLKTTNRVRKRFQYEAFEFELRDDDICVRNGSYADPENHEYTVRIEDDLPTACTCPADAKYSGACKHRVAVALRQPILDAVRHHQLLADGGETVQPRTTLTTTRRTPKNKQRQTNRTVTVRTSPAIFRAGSATGPDDVTSRIAYLTLRRPLRSATLYRSTITSNRFRTL